MDLSTPALVSVGAALLALLAVVLRRRRGDRGDLIAPPPTPTSAPAPQAPPPRVWPAGAAPIGDLPPDLAAEVRALLDQDRKIEAIKIARAATGLSLADAKELVERM